MPDVLRVLFPVRAWAGRDRVAGVVEQLVGLLVHAHDRDLPVVGPGVDLQDVFHPGHELAVGFGRDGPALLQMRTKLRLLKARPIVE